LLEGSELRVKPRLHIRFNAEGLARGQLVELHVWKSRKVFPSQSNSEKKSSSTVISLVDTREAVCSCVLIKLDQKKVFPVRFVWAYSQKGLR